MQDHSGLSQEEALKKLQRYCAYQDRSHQEVRSKLLSLHVYGQDLENVMAFLIEENFLNEERFARSFARGKFRIKKWGRLRIRKELKRRDISDYCIRKGMAEIDEEDYLQTIRNLIHKKTSLLKESDEFLRNKKIALFLQSRGFEMPLVWEIIRSMHDER